MSLRRDLEATMGDAVYSILGNQPSIEGAWTLMRDLIGEHIFGSEFVPVPFIESAAYFNQLFVFVKRKSIFTTVGFCPPTYKIVGNLDYLVNREISTWTPQFDFSPWDMADGQRLYREFRLRIWSANHIGVQKAIIFHLLEAHMRSAQPPTPGNVRIYRNLLHELSNVNKLYVITDVVLASRLRLSVRIGNENVVFDTPRDIPIGFRYRKYKLRKDGTFINELETMLRVQTDEAIWKRPFPQPIPNMPVWDYMRRSYHNDIRRKLRHNLTIPTQGGVPALLSERTRREGDRGTLERNFAIENFQAANIFHMDDNDGLEEEWLNEMLQRAPDPENRRGANRATVSIETLHGSD